MRTIHDRLDSTKAMLFDEEELTPWLKEWQGMPEFINQDLMPEFSIVVHFTSAGDVGDFAKLMGQTVNPKAGRQMQSIWFPERDTVVAKDKRYIEVPQ